MKNTIHDDFYSNLNTLASTNNHIKADLYKKYSVKRGLRNENGTGVLVGLTNVSSVVGYELKDQAKIPVEGKLFYRGVNLEDFVNGFQNEKRRGLDRKSVV